MISTILSLIFLAGVALFVVSTLVVLFHFFYYRIEKGEHQMIMAVFIAGSLVLLCAEFIVFSQIRWDAVNDMLNQYVLHRTL